MPIASFRVLASEFRIRCEAPDFLSRLTGNVTRARHEHPILVRHDWQVALGPGGYRLIDDSGAGTIADTIDELHGQILRRISAEALAALPQHGLMRAAIGHHEGRCFLLVGDRGSGKTTLALALLLAGIEISGDDMVLWRADEAMAYPQRFHFWEPTRDLLPALPPYQGAPLLAGGNRQLKIPVDPIDLGCDWRIRSAPIAALFCLDTNFGGQSLLRRCSAVEALHRVVPQCGAPPSGDPAWIGPLSNLLAHAHTAILTLGTLDSAIRWIRIALDRLPPAETLAQ
jgi:energy-coupling factor transporter ATP-binding protein EcfA2